MFKQTGEIKVIQKLITLEKFINKEALSGIILFIATVAAVIVANSSWGQDYYDLWHLPLGINLGGHEISMSLTYWIDDGLMALFFLMVGLEIKREMLIGELSTVSKAAFPIVAAIGGMLVPAKIFFVVLLVAYSFSLEYFRKQLEKGEYTKSGKFFRAYNEVPTFLAILIVGYVVTKTFSLAFTLITIALSAFVIYKVFKQEEKTK